MWLRVIIFVWYWYYDMNLIWPKKMFLWFQSYSVTVQSTTWSFAGLFGTTLCDWTTLSTPRSSSTRSLQTTWRDSCWSCQGKPLTRTLSTTSLKLQLSYTGNRKKSRIKEVMMNGKLTYQQPPEGTRRELPFKTQDWPSNKRAVSTQGAHYI